MARCHLQTYRSIFTTDDPETIERKGFRSVHREGNRQLLYKGYWGEIRIHVQYSGAWSHFDDGKDSFERSLKCRTGNLLCGECKSDLATQTKSFMSEFTKRRDQASNQVHSFLFEENPFE